MKRRAISFYPDDPKAYQLADYIAHCSQYCCGNPRKWFKERTISEIKNDIIYFEEIDLLDISNG